MQVIDFCEIESVNISEENARKLLAASDMLQARKSNYAFQDKSEQLLSTTDSLLQMHRHC